MRPPTSKRFSLYLFSRRLTAGRALLNPPQYGRGMRQGTVFFSSLILPGELACICTVTVRIPYENPFSTSPDIPISQYLTLFPEPVSWHSLPLFSHSSPGLSPLLSFFFLSAKYSRSRIVSRVDFQLVNLFFFYFFFTLFLTTCVCQNLQPQHPLISSILSRLFLFNNTHREKGYLRNKKYLFSVHTNINYFSNKGFFLKTSVV